MRNNICYDDKYINRFIILGFGDEMKTEIESRLYQKLKHKFEHR